MPPLETLTEQPVKKSTFLDRIERHPYFAIAVIMIIVILIGLVIVLQRIGVGASRGGVTWTGAGSVFFTSGSNISLPERQTAQDIIKDASPDTELGYIPLPQTINKGGEEEGDSGLEDLLSQLVQPQATGTTPDFIDIGAYSFIPTGLISAEMKVQSLTSTQEALRSYGNEVGTYVQGFESLNSNVAQMLKDQAEDRTNPDKTSAVDKLGYAYAALGRDLTQMNPENIPAMMKSAHTAYATTYRIVGTNMTKIAKATNDEEFISALEKYNESVDSLTTRFVAIVSIFTANGVTFSSTEPGSIFMFSGAASTSL